MQPGQKNYGQNRYGYYPFGLTFNSYQREGSLENKYQYNGKEEQEELGWYDYHARNYDPALGRWFNIDPLTDLSRRWSPYTYCYNNPLLFVDPDGMFGEYYDQKGNHIGSDENKGDGKVYVVTDKKDVKSIQATNEQGGTTKAGTVKSAVQLPSAHVRGEMGKAVERAGDSKEEGGYFGTTRDGTEKVVHAKSGQRAELGSDTKAEIDVFDAANPEDVKNNPINEVEGTFHTHPGDIEHYDQNRNEGTGAVSSIGKPSGSNSWGQPPSPTDYENASENSSFVRGNSYVLGLQGKGTVYIYNGSNNKPVATFPLKEFISIGIK